MRLYVVPIPRAVWDSQEFRILHDQFHASLRRIEKGIDLRLERNRYSNAVHRLAGLCLAEMRGRVHPFPEQYNAMLLDDIVRHGAKVPIIGPDHTPRFIRERWRGLELLAHREINNAYAFFILQDPFSGQEVAPSDADPMEVRVKEFSFEATIDHLKDRKAEKYMGQILDCIRQGNPIGWLNLSASAHVPLALARHEVLTKVLRELVSERFFRERISNPDPEFSRALADKTLTTRFAYEDGSVGRDIPILSLSEADIDGIDFETFPVALVSCRHFELDALTDGSLIRNSELSIRDGFNYADQEEYCHERTYAFIKDLLSNGRRVELKLYHTGLETAIIGIYSAVIRLFGDPLIRGRLRVVPVIYKGGEKYEELESWQ